MESLREIRGKIKAVQSIERVTRSMKLIAGIRLRQTERKLRSNQPYAKALIGMLGELVSKADLSHPLLQARAVTKRYYIIITSDRSLCGSYNFGVVRLAEGILAGPTGTRIMALGRFGYRYFRFLGYDLFPDYDQIGDGVEFASIRQLGAELIRDYLNGTVDEVNVIYTKYHSQARQEPTLIRLLPVAPDSIRSSDEEELLSDYLFEPSAEGVLMFLLPKYINYVLYSAILEAKTSEQAARTMAMSQATQNAVDLLEELNLEYNRSRQGAITDEIIEILGAAEVNR
jgi:F-type H+-transporting ATPase subunit gamma